MNARPAAGRLQTLLVPVALLAAVFALASPAAARPPPGLARAVVAAIARVAAENASRPEAERADGDALADAYLRAGAFAARRDRAAFFLGALHAVDGAGALAKFPPVKAILDGLETPDAAAARRAALGRPRLRGRADLLLHMLAAGAVASFAGEGPARAVAFAKEAADAKAGGSGFSFADVLADEAGIALAVALAGPAAPSVWERLEASFSGDDLLPDPAGEPEGLAAEAFATAFGGPDDPRFVAKRDALRARVEDAPFLEPRPPRDLSALLSPIPARHGIPGMAGAVTWRGRTTALGAAGVRAAGTPQPATVDDLWHLGSCTKSMTATLAALHVERGGLAWDTTVAKGLAGRVQQIDLGWKDVTLDLLLHNRGGAPANLDAGGLGGRLCGFQGTPTEARLELAEGVLSRPPPTPPGTKHVYSNAGFAVAGAMLEAESGTPWETLIERELWAPLSIVTGGFGAPGTRGTIDQPRGHDVEGKPVEPGPGSDNPAAIGPAGTVRMSIGDWAKYVALHVEGEGIAPRLLSPTTFRRLHAPLPGDEASYAMGWVVAERPWGGRVLTHNGSNTMWYCVTWLSPSKEFGVLVTCNRGGDEASKGCDEAAWALIQDHLAHEGAAR